MNIAVNSPNPTPEEKNIQTEIVVNGHRLNTGQTLAVATAVAGFWSDLQVHGLGPEKAWQDLTAYHSEQLRAVVALFGPASEIGMPILVDYSADLFVADPDVRAGVPVSPSIGALCDAVEVWLHARPDHTLVTVGEAAAVFNVSARFLISAFDRRCSKYFYLSGEGEANASRIFVREAGL